MRGTCYESGLFPLMTLKHHLSLVCLVFFGLALPSHAVQPYSGRYQIHKRPVMPHSSLSNRPLKTWKQPVGSSHKSIKPKLAQGPKSHLNH